MKLPFTRVATSGRFILLIILIGVGLLWITRSIFTVKSVNCYLASGESCSELLRTQAATLIDTPFFGVDWQTRLSTVFSSQSVAVTDYQLIFPDQLTLILLADRPAYRVQLEGKLLTIDESGNNMFLDGSDYPIISIDQKIQDQVVGQDNINAEYHQLFMQLSKSVPSLGTFELKSEYRLEIITPDKTYIVNPQQPAAQVVQLLKYAQQIDWNKIEGPVVEVDLRYREPVLRQNQTTRP